MPVAVLGGPWRRCSK
ncbi:hypothetical protein TIFTF001_056022 [Ficus carica]|uniref:Uncharacterized protein n=1 Tax=Ficus carica TaxID=3494 RepID=A0AA88EDM7_FICCA|nr:hypothetical protein TIFTF001_056022 [Ficus carica]